MLKETVNLLVYFSELRELQPPFKLWFVGRN